MKYYLGIDVGGSNTRVAKVDENGVIVEVVKRAIDGMSGRDNVLPQIFDLIREITDYQGVAGIGAGVPGPVETVEGVMTMSTNLEGFKGFPLKATFEKEFGIPTFVDNDANVAGLAEALLGAGKGKSVIYYTTISTGIGGAMIVNGRVMSGSMGWAGEIGNIIVDRTRPNRGLGLNSGAMEAEAGGRALTIRAKEIFGADKINHAGDFFDLARAGNPTAVEMLETITEDWAIGFSAICHIVNPAALVVGGGLLKSGDVWYDKFVTKLYERIHKGMHDMVVVKAELEEPGLVGAAMLPVSFGI